MAVIALAGGGTGGHVYPALAMGDALAAHGHDIVYYGDPGRLEGRVVPARGMPFREVTAAQFPRGSKVGKVRFVGSLLKGIVATRQQLSDDGVDLVLGVGGYISAPTVLAAWSLGIPTVIHEANATPGLANRLCARVADAVLLTFEEAGPRLATKAPQTVVGVPVNAEKLHGDRTEASQRYDLDPARATVLFVGGSLGAERINGLAMTVAKQGVQVLHLCGPRYEERIREAWGRAMPENYRLVGYEDQMGMAYAMADLVVCRAGSSTLAELTALGKPSVLIPSPHVTDNHQEANARGLESKGAALVEVEKDWHEPTVAGDIRALLGDTTRLAAMSEAARGMAHTSSAEEAAKVVLALLPAG